MLIGISRVDTPCFHVRQQRFLLFGPRQLQKYLTRAMDQSKASRDACSASHLTLMETISHDNDGEEQNTLCRILRGNRRNRTKVRQQHDYNRTAMTATFFTEMVAIDLRTLEVNTMVRGREKKNERQGVMLPRQCSCGGAFPKEWRP